MAEHTGCVPLDLFGKNPFPQVGEKAYPLMLGPHGFLWLALQKPPDENGPRGPEDYEAPLITVERGWDELLFGGERVQLEQILPGFLCLQPWFHGGSKTVLSCTIQSILPVQPGDNPARLYLATLRVDYNQGDPETYIRPLQVDEPRDHAPGDDVCPAIARLALAGDEEETAVLRDAAYNARFTKALLRPIVQPDPSQASLQSIHARRTPVADSLRDMNLGAAEVGPALSGRYNSIAVVGGRAVLKLFRRVQEGVNPDLELTLHLSQQGYQNAPAVAGALLQPGAYRENITLAVVTPFVSNQGTGWGRALDAFREYLEHAGQADREWHAQSISPQAIAAAIQGDLPHEARELIGEYLDEVSLLGAQTGELHAALARDRQHPSLAPEQFSEFYQRSLYQRLRSAAIRAFRRLEEARETLPESFSSRITELLSRREVILDGYEVLRRRQLRTSKPCCPCCGWPGPCRPNACAISRTSAIWVRAR